MHISQITDEIRSTRSHYAKSRLGRCVYDAVFAFAYYHNGANKKDVLGAVRNADVDITESIIAEIDNAILAATNNF